ncbi:GGDEF domain-containing protein [Arenimonas caeni]|uniref:GGDEF domain-containing protein n=1 Tax=Arenimonas caeni TaxID=2058085 RepID=UPI002A36CCD3|nr:GGDEF domain-containing protein [Arenimonas caeni]MDY0022861.1 GGDEF domain-containing protein [Arenimonas caeni]
MTGGLFYVFGWMVISVAGEVFDNHAVLGAGVGLAFLVLAMLRVWPRQPALDATRPQLERWLDRQWGVVLATAALWGGVLSWTLLDRHLAPAMPAALLCTVAFATAFAHNFSLRLERALLGVALVYLPAPLLLPHTDAGLAVTATVGVYAIYLALVLVRSHRDYQRQLDLYDALRHQRDQYERLSRIDPLTGLANRRHHGGTLDHLGREAQRLRQPLSMLVMDLDHFKRVNDELGHDAGDACLARFADRMREIFTEPGAHLSRLGGEEFGVLLPGLDAVAAAAAAERMRASLETQPLQLREGPLAITVSIGVATYLPSQGGSLGDLFRAADRAMYQAKADGRNRVCVDGA